MSGIRLIVRMSFLFFGSILILNSVIPDQALAQPSPAKAPEKSDEYQERKLLFEKMSALMGIPWYYFAAVDQYERALSAANPKKRPPRNGLIAIQFSETDWKGPLNPNPEDVNPVSISFFNGIGKDGSGDGKADRHNDIDVLYTMAKHLLRHGTTHQDFLIGVWEYYHNSRSVERIEQFAKIYAHFDRLNLFEYKFPLPPGVNYSYRSTWGAARSWGGFRIHEGTDIFTHYGVPVRSTCFGIIEVMGWNRFGGWRVGIRDLNNMYHYYAHLSGFNKSLKEGDIVKPGDVIGWVGSSGYGKPGTQGKFPPHLHYGLYRDNGYVDWSFDPYGYLVKWERQERKSKKRN